MIIQSAALRRKLVPLFYSLILGLALAALWVALNFGRGVTLAPCARPSATGLDAPVPERASPGQIFLFVVRAGAPAQKVETCLWLSGPGEAN